MIYRGVDFRRFSPAAVDPARVRRIGPVGSGSALKLVVNQGLGVLAAGLGEALLMAGQLGLDRDVVLDVLEQGAYAFTVKQKRELLARGDFSDARFSVDLLAKDLGVELEIVPVTSSNRIPYVVTRRADLVISSLSILTERAKSIAFSTPYGNMQPTNMQIRIGSLVNEITPAFDAQ